MEFKTIDITKEEIEGVFGEDTACWFIVNIRHKKAFLKLLANRFITDGCRHFDFFGKHAQKWENIFDDTDIELKPELTVDNVALTMAWDSKDDFAEAMSCTSKEKNYLFYDDTVGCEEILQLFEKAKMEE